MLKAIALALALVLPLRAAHSPCTLDRATGKSIRLAIGTEYNEHPTVVPPTGDYFLGDIQDSLTRQAGLVKIVRFTCP